MNMASKIFWKYYSCLENDGTHVYKFGTKSKFLID